MNHLSRRELRKQGSDRLRRQRFYLDIAAGRLTVGEAAKLMRKISRLTQTRFAEHRGVSLLTLKRVEGGRGNPSIGTLDRISSIFGLRAVFVHENPRVAAWWLKQAQDPATHALPGGDDVGAGLERPDQSCEDTATELEDQALRNQPDIEAKRALRDRFSVDIAAGRLSVGETVKLIRKIHGLTQAQLAKNRGVSVVTLRKVESGRGNPTVGTLNRIGNIAGLRVGFVHADPAAAARLREEAKWGDGLAADEPRTPRRALATTTWQPWLL